MIEILWIRGFWVSRGQKKKIDDFYPTFPSKLVPEQPEKATQPPKHLQLFQLQHTKMETRSDERQSREQTRQTSVWCRDRSWWGSEDNERGSSRMGVGVGFLEVWLWGRLHWKASTELLEGVGRLSQALKQQTQSQSITHSKNHTELCTKGNMIGAPPDSGL